jgi:hypothetical protein
MADWRLTRANLKENEVLGFVKGSEKDKGEEQPRIHIPCAYRSCADLRHPVLVDGVDFV